MEQRTESDKVIVSLQISNTLLREEIRNLTQEINYFERTEMRLKDDAKRLENTIKMQADKIAELQDILDKNKAEETTGVYSTIKHYLGFKASV
jgi:chromosome segregation ATPase